MDDFPQRLSKLSSAEDFLDFFGIAYRQSVVNVCRLHIMKRFFQYLRQEDGLAGLSEVELFLRYRSRLAQAYRDFVESTPAEQKVFKVFQEAGGKKCVTLESLRATLPSTAP